jgi:hypothetical protein
MIFRLKHFDMLCICCVYALHKLTNLFCQGHDSAPGLNIMLLKQQHLSVSGHAANQVRHHPPVENMYSHSHPLLQCLLQKLAEWMANNYAAGLNVPPRPDLSRPWSTATFNCILQTCIVSDSRGINIHSFQSVEFKSDLYSWVMSARCYPFNMECHQFQVRNVRVSTYTWHMYCISCVYVCHILGIYMY